MSNYGIIRKHITQCIGEGWRKFIIFPFGENGMLSKQILEQAFDIRDIVVCDNELSEYNRNIVSIDALRRMKVIRDYALIIASTSREIIEYAHSQIDCGKTVEIAENFNQSLTQQVSGGGDIGRYSYGPLAIPNFKVEKVGSFCSFAAGVDAVWNHQLNMVTNHDFIYEDVICREIDNQTYKYSDFNKRFVIGNDVWLGRNVILTNGVTIGNGVRVGAGAVVTKDLPDYAIAVGVPAKIIGYRFTPDQINKLNKIAWWDWPVEKIKKCYDDFADIRIFLEKHYSDEE